MEIYAGCDDIICSDVYQFIASSFDSSPKLSDTSDIYTPGTTKQATMTKVFWE